MALKSSSYHLQVHPIGWVAKTKKENHCTRPTTTSNNFKQRKYKQRENSKIRQQVQPTQPSPTACMLSHLSPRQTPNRTLKNIVFIQYLPPTSQTTYQGYLSQNHHTDKKHSTHY